MLYCHSVITLIVIDTDCNYAVFLIHAECRYAECVIFLGVVMLTGHNAYHCFTEFHYAERRSTECRFAECSSATFREVFQPLKNNRLSVFY